MNTTAIRNALDTIDRNQKAIAWFEQFGDDMKPANVIINVQSSIGTMEPGHFPAMEALTGMLIDQIGPQMTETIEHCVQIY